jgi:hypothetical protein
MTVENGYVTLSALKASLATISDTADDARLERVIRDTSRWWDSKTGRHFYPVIATRTFTATGSQRLVVPDLISVSALATDEDGDRTYETAWTSTCYDLEPFDSTAESPPAPYHALSVTPDSSVSFPPGNVKGVQITGKFGYYEVLSSAGQLDTALTAAGTTVTMKSTGPWHAGELWLVDSEYLMVDAESTTTAVTLRRAMNGSAGATHSSGSGVNRLTFPVVEDACLRESTRRFRAEDAPYGVAGSGEFGQATIVTSFDPIVWQDLMAFRRLVVP